MTALFWSLVLLLIAMVALLTIADRRVASADSWESIDRWLLAGSYAAPGAILVAGAVVGCGLALWVA